MLLQQVVILVMTYLSTMCVAKYNNVLTSSQQSRATEQGATASTSPPEGDAATNGGVSPRLRSLSAPHAPHLVLAAAKGREGGDRRGSEQSERDGTASVSPPPNPQDVSEQVQAAMEKTGPFLCQLLLEHKPILSKVLVGAGGRQLISESELLV